MKITLFRITLVLFLALLGTATYVLSTENKKPAVYVDCEKPILGFYYCTGKK